MEDRQLGCSGFFVPLLKLGTGTFGGKGLLAAWGTTHAAETTWLIDICLDQGLTMFDSADIYSNGESEKVLDDEYPHRVVDALDVDALEVVAKESGKTVPQVALNWLVQRPIVCTLILGARNKQQLKDNPGAVGCNLTPEQIKKLDQASAVTMPYPYWYQRHFRERIAFPTRV